MLDSTKSLSDEHTVNTRFSRDEVSEIIAEALNASKANLSLKQAALLSVELQPVIMSAVERVFKRTLDRVNPVDPVSGLSVPPVARERYRFRSSAHKSLKPHEFLREIWGDYQDAGLLYTGHLKKVDHALYNALIYRSKTALSEVESPTEAHYADQLLSQFRILSAYHIKHPESVPPEFKSQAALISRTVSTRVGAAGARLEGALRAVAMD